MKSDYKQTSSVTSMMDELGWKPLHERRREQRLTLLFKIVNDLVAIPADHHIRYNNRTSRNRHSKQLKVESANSDIYKNSFFPRTIIDWNNLPQSAIDCDTVENFKRTISRDQVTSAHTPLDNLCSANESISSIQQIQIAIFAIYLERRGRTRDAERGGGVKVFFS